MRLSPQRNPARLSTPRRSDWADGTTRYDRFAASAVWIALWISWPLLQVVGNGPIFFLARGGQQSDVLFTVFAVGIALPVVGGIPSAVLPSALGRTWFLSSSVIASLALAGQVLPALTDRSVAIWVIAASALGFGQLHLFDRVPAFRLLLRYLSFAPVAVAAVFLISTPSGAIVIGDDSSPPKVGRAAETPAPLLFVVFDELPTASLVNPDGEINSNWYPGFAKLQADSTWFRNAATVHQQSDQAVPAVLAGIVPETSDLPILRDYPQSIFTLLGSEYSILSHESLTQLCPENRCIRAVGAPGTLDRWRLMIDDLGLVGAHTFLPEHLTLGLPRIDQQWANFGKIAQLDAAHTPKEDAAAYLEAMQDFDHGLSAFVVHLMLPHRPWVYLPDGSIYGDSASPTSVGMGIGTAWQTDQSRQRHLLQAQYADAVLSEFISALSAMDIYDRALIVVTADHGVSFSESGADRIVSADSIGEIGLVPLFIKYPGGTDAGAIDDYRALTVDIVPTIADVLGLEIPAPVDGVSLASGERPARNSTVTWGPNGSLEWSAGWIGGHSIVLRTEDRFPDGNVFALRLEGTPDLIGTHASALTGFDRTTAWEVQDAEKFQHVGEPGASPPALVTGRMDGSLPEQLVVVAVNDVVLGATRSYLHHDGDSAFEVVVDPERFNPGWNDVEIYVRPWAHAGD